MIFIREINPLSAKLLERNKATADIWLSMAGYGAKLRGRQAR